MKICKKSLEREGRLSFLKVWVQSNNVSLHPLHQSPVFYSESKENPLVNNLIPGGVDSDIQSTTDNSNLPLTRSKFRFPSADF